ncbi:MAG TPA: glycosyltransferase family 2 protein [Xanthobacteraceae bacterium]|nr:glycosyltransferase family 2 protein [Xanthobacteraceae bacterium]
MKLIMTLLVRDEDDIIASNIDFHLDRGVDFIIATDNLSVDGTTDILRSYERKGLLHYIHQSDDDFSQGQWVTHMARLACVDYGADWVINNDADEFWWPGQDDLKGVLNAMPPSCDAVNARRVNFLPRPTVEGDFFADTMTVRERQSRNALGQPLPDKVCHRAYSDIEVEQGNHGMHRRGRSVAAEPGAITVLHFPMRSYPQFANKIAKGGAAYERNTHLPIELGATWRYLYGLYRRGELEAYYRASVADQEAIERGLKDGHLVRDERVRAALSPGQIRAPRSNVSRGVY